MDPRLTAVIDRIYTEPVQLVEQARGEMRTHQLCARMRDAMERVLVDKMSEVGRLERRRAVGSPP